jgi:rare lipoprotein A
MKVRRGTLGGIAFFALTTGIGAAQDTGIAAYYSDYFVGKSAANGEIYSHDALTAAHNGYPFGTQVRVTNLSNNQSVVVKINDRMRKKSTVLIDLSRRAAQELDFLKEGKTQVRVEPVGAGDAASAEVKSTPVPE